MSRDGDDRDDADRAFFRTLPRELLVKLLHFHGEFVPARGPDRRAEYAEARREAVLALYRSWLRRLRRRR